MEEYQVYDIVLSCLDFLEWGIWYRLLLKFPVDMMENNAVVLVHVGFIHIFLSQYLTGGLIYVLLLELGYFYINIVALNSSVNDDGWDLRVKKSSFCCKSRQYIVPVPSLPWKTCPRISVQYWRLSPRGHCPGPWSFYPLWAPDIGYWSMFSCLYTYLAWMHVPPFCKFIPLTHSN